jgi:hypothetical protein
MMMHRWTVTVTVESRQGQRLTPASAKLLAAELAHLNPTIDAAHSPPKVELSILAADPEAAFLYTRRRITQVLLPIWTTDLAIDLLDVVADAGAR